MSEQIKHECGIAMIRLLKPLDYYHKKYGTALYGLNKLYLLMQKQQNRGQDGAGVATIKLDTEAGKRYISRSRNNSNQSIKALYAHIHEYFKDVTPEQYADPQWLKDNKPFIGELLLGHLRYGTHGVNSIEACHPVLRQNNWKTRNLVLAGNFNLTNVDEMFKELVGLGQHPKEKSDTVTMLEKIGHFLDTEVQRLFSWYKSDDYENHEITDLIAENINILRILQRAAKKFDGGFVMAGLIGHGDAFVMRDPAGIRPAFYYQDDEVVVVASERPAIQTALNVPFGTIKEVPAGHALIIKKNGTVNLAPFAKPTIQKPCSFERIYFSRGTDKDIYLERKKLGEQLAEPIMEMVDYDFANTVFSYVPNTAETAFYGMVKGLEDCLDKVKQKQILALGDDVSVERLKPILSQRARVEKLVVKDMKLRTFITEDASRSELVSHVYDVTYGIVKNGVDTLVLMDDSIVRGTTLRQSIIKIVSRLKPKRIIVVSSAPQIRYPDCYGIDMSKMGDFVAFRALVELLKENNKEDLMEQVYERCKAQEHLPKEQVKNEVQVLFEEFTQQEISAKIAEIVTPPDTIPQVDVLYQSIEGLHKACPNHAGDWYFSGNYPTPGGNKVVNKAFILYMEKKNVRAY